MQKKGKSWAGTFETCWSVSLKFTPTSLTLPVLNLQVKVLAVSFQSNIPQNLSSCDLSSAPHRRKLCKSCWTCWKTCWCCCATLVFMIWAQSSHVSEVIRQNAAHSAEKLQDNERKRIFLTFLWKKRLCGPCRTTVWRFYNSCCFCQWPRFTFWKGHIKLCNLLQHKFGNSHPWHQEFSIWTATQKLWETMEGMLNMSMLCVNWSNTKWLKPPKKQELVWFNQTLSLCHKQLTITA